jgi:hypothetical protein
VSSYYLRKDGKTFGPCSQEDLRNYLLYGSVLPADEVRREGELHFQPLAQMPEFQRRWTWRWPWKRPRRVEGPVRYRDYRTVPPQRRSGAVLRMLVLGLLLFPPRLWSVSLRVWRHQIWGRRRDEQGFLKPWPPFMRWVVLALLLLQCLAILIGLEALIVHGPAMVRKLLQLIYRGI